MVASRRRLAGFLTVGAENNFGNEGGTVYFDGVGTPPAPSFAARVRVAELDEV